MGDAANPPYAASSGVVYSNDFDPPDIDSRATGENILTILQFRCALECIKIPTFASFVNQTPDMDTRQCNLRGVVAHW